MVTKYEINDLDKYGHIPTPMRCGGLLFQNLPPHSVQTEVQYMSLSAEQPRTKKNH